MRARLHEVLFVPRFQCVATVIAGTLRAHREVEGVGALVGRLLREPEVCATRKEKQFSKVDVFSDDLSLAVASEYRHIASITTDTEAAI